MYWIDEKYILEISSQLERFKKTADNVYNHRCPFCGDSEKDKTKARGYHFQYKGSMIYKCHNCGLPLNTGQFLKRLDEDLYKRYIKEKIKESGSFGGFKSTKKKPDVKKEKKIDKPLFDRLLDNVLDLDENHKAVKLLKERKIPKTHWNDIYYIDDMRKIGQLSSKYKEKLKSSEDRLVIALRDRKGDVKGITCRSFDKNAKLRYVAIKINDDFPMVYGLNRLNENKIIYVLEGAFDSMFIPNAVSVSGTNLNKVEKLFKKEQVVIVFDCEPRNKEVVKLIKKAIDKNYKVALLPYTGFKDINMMIQNGYSTKKILSMINSNTYQGLKAKIFFNKWKKI